eukprot:36989-Rhodomonas_salina.5
MRLTDTRCAAHRRGAGESEAAAERQARRQRGAHPEPATPSLHSRTANGVLHRSFCPEKFFPVLAFAAYRTRASSSASDMRAVRALKRGIPARRSEGSRLRAGVRSTAQPSAAAPLSPSSFSSTAPKSACRTTMGGHRCTWLRATDMRRWSRSGPCFSAAREGGHVWRGENADVGRGC